MNCKEHPIETPIEFKDHAAIPLSCKEPTAVGAVVVCKLSCSQSSVGATVPSRPASLPPLSAFA
jgi:hypothetical protein